MIGFDLFPPNVAQYEDVDWVAIFEQFSHIMSPT